MRMSKAFAAAATIAVVGTGGVRANPVATAAVDTRQDACMLAGKAFSSGATVMIGGERVHCFKGFGSMFWVEVAKSDEENDGFVFCIAEGIFYSMGSILGDVTCNGNGNWN